MAEVVTSAVTAAENITAEAANCAFLAPKKFLRRGSLLA
jgi:hypothetical protein